MVKLQVLYSILLEFQEFLPPDFFQRSEENSVFSSFWSFEENVRTFNTFLDKATNEI